MVEDRRTLGLTESIEEAERLCVEDFDTWVMTGYYLYSKLWRSGVSAHFGTWGNEIGQDSTNNTYNPRVRTSDILFSQRQLKTLTAPSLS